jgi:chorismate mutase
MILRRLLTQLLRVPTVRALRGATTVTHDDPVAIRDAVIELLDALRMSNDLADAEVISAIFTMTSDLCSAFPAETAREVGWSRVPLLCTSEVPVPGGMPRCLRVLVHAERDWGDRPPRHIYLRGAGALRPDLAMDRVTDPVAAVG